MNLDKEVSSLGLELMRKLRPVIILAKRFIFKHYSCHEYTDRRTACGGPAAWPGAKESSGPIAIGKLTSWHCEL